MNWQTLAVVAAVIVPIFGALNAWLLVQVRLELSGLRIEMLQQRTLDREEVRKWVEAEYWRRSEIETHMNALDARLSKLENRPLLACAQRKRTQATDDLVSLVDRIKAA